MLLYVYALILAFVATAYAQCISAPTIGLPTPNQLIHERELVFSGRATAQGGGVCTVQLFVDDVLVGQVDTTSNSWTFRGDLGLADGPHVLVARNSVGSSPQRRFIYAPDCETPNFTTPGEFGVSDSTSVVLRGSTSPRCRAYTIEDINTGEIVAEGTAEADGQITQPLTGIHGVNEYIVTVRGEHGNLPSAYYVTFQVIITCPSPSISTTDGATVQSDSISLGGFVEPYCYLLLIEITGPDGSTRSVQTGGPEQSVWITSVSSLADGTYTYVVRATRPDNAPGDNQTPDPSLPTAARTFTILAAGCEPPVVDAPGPRVFDGRVSFSGYDMNGGRVQCRLIGLSVNGKTYLITPVDAASSRKRNTMRTWSHTLPEEDSLDEGSYTYQTWTQQATLNEAGEPTGTTPVMGEDREVEVVAQDEPSGVAEETVLRKRKVCAWEEELCTSITPAGKLIRECVRDLDSNLERCGACDGPDCTSIPNVDEVSCYQGRCLITSCVAGYKPNGDRCVATSTSQSSYLRQQRRRL